MSSNPTVIFRIDDDELQLFLRNEPNRNDQVLNEWKNQGSREVQQVMRNNSPFKSGFFRESITTRFTPKGFTTYPAIDYAKIVEEGSKPHIIRPINVKALRWFGRWGQPIFAKKVSHPGTKGQFVVKKTYQQVRGYLKQLYEHIWRMFH